MATRMHPDHSRGWKTIQRNRLPEPAHLPAAESRMNESRSFRPWPAGRAPARVLIMRLQAIGDVAATLPACSSLRKLLPGAHIAFLTSPLCAGIPASMVAFDRVFVLRQDGPRPRRVLAAMMMGARVRAHRFDLVIDLQRHARSRLIRYMALARAWGEFDRFSPRPALERTLDTFGRAGFAGLDPIFRVDLKTGLKGMSLNILRRHGWDECEKIVLLNPAGLWVTRNWPLARYEELTNLWLSFEPVKFLFLGTERTREKVQPLARKLGDRAIELTCRTSLDEALGILQHVSVAVSEDSGLLHMAWASGVPTVALLGSTRSDWSRPLGKRARLLGSEDLPCGACMEPLCRFGDVHCLSRHSAAAVFELALQAMRG